MLNIYRLTVALVVLGCANVSYACGGFFCQILPIDQAAEQIIFRQDGSNITTAVRIRYTGEAENFGWVLPVPNTPELSLGSDTLFSQLELATRPQFALSRSGEECDTDTNAPTPLATPAASASDGGGEADGVVVESQVTIGAFDAQVISGDDSQAVANWLAENNLDLSDRGAELLEPYVDANMKFVVLKLQNDADVGDIQPIILNYESDKPMIPIKLTAIAAEEDMGVLVWLISDQGGRAVPENFLHVVPNYTRLNWYTGSRNAYVSYQDLITEAMDEAGGQGFATDFSGRFQDLIWWLTEPGPIEELLAGLESENDAQFLAQIRGSLSSTQLLAEYQEALPLPDGQNGSIYFSGPALATQYTEQELASARSVILEYVTESILVPLQNTYDMIDDDLYLTRLYTTLSPEEMTVDPVFVFNPDLPEQQLTREANLDVACVDGQTEWTLTLGEGTGREDEWVIEARDPVPASAPEIEQAASWRIEKTYAEGASDIQEERDFQVAKVGDVSGNTGGGSAGLWMAILCLAAGLRTVRRLVP